MVPKPISPTYMFVMWFSGLRGGVAFALASVSYGNGDFPQTCGGLEPIVAAAKGIDCRADDSTAMLQTTIIIAAFTIFVFGGTITDVAKYSGILQDNSPAGKRAAKKEEHFNKRTDLWTQIDKSLTPHLASSKSYNRVKDIAHVESILNAPDSILASDSRGSEWFFRQENEWALAEVLEKITKVQGQFRGRLTRNHSKPKMYQA